MDLRLTDSFIESLCGVMDNELSFWLPRRLTVVPTTGASNVYDVAPHTFWKNKLSFGFIHVIRKLREDNHVTKYMAVVSVSHRWLRTYLGKVRCQTGPFDKVKQHFAAVAWLPYNWARLMTVLVVHNNEG